MSVRRSTAASMKFIFPGSSYSLPSASRIRNSRWLGIVLVERTAELALHLQQALLPDAEVRIHRIGLVDGGEQRRVRGDHAADADQRAAHDTVDGRADLGVVEVELGRLHRRLRGLHQALSRGVGGDRRVELSLAQGVDRGQRARTGQITCRLRFCRMRLGKPRLRLGECGDVRLRIDFEQHFAVLHRRALARCLAEENSRHLRADLDGVRGLELRRILLRERGGARLHGQRRHRLRRRRPGGLAPAGRRGAEQGRYGEPRCPAKPTRSRNRRWTHSRSITRRPAAVDS